jgi:hypothetical protein
VSEVDGATLIARSLKQQGIDHLFGVVGFPVTPIAAASQKEGVACIGMRNEQAYAPMNFALLVSKSMKSKSRRTDSGETHGRSRESRTAAGPRPAIEPHCHAGLEGGHIVLRVETKRDVLRSCVDSGCD